MVVSRACPGAGSQNQLAFDSSPFRKTQEHISCTTNTPVNTEGPNHVVLRLYWETQPGHGETLLLRCGFLRGVHQQLHFPLQAFHLSFLMPTMRKDEIETCFSHKLKYKKAGFGADWIPYRSEVGLKLQLSLPSVLAKHISPVTRWPQRETKALPPAHPSSEN